MGGIGSGTWCRWNKKTTIEETKRIDIHYMRKRGFLKPGTYGKLSWTCGGEPCGNIDFKATENQLVLSYRFRHHGEDWEPVEQKISLDTTPCRFGGERKWFFCPKCLRRIAILCVYDKYFLCRHCYQLPYGSQNEDVFGRMIRKRDKLFDKAFDGSVYRKKKGLHYRTFERLRSRYWQLEFEVDSAIEAKINRYFPNNGRLVK